MKVLVFGSRGYVGTHIRSRAAALGFQIEEVSSLLGNGLDRVTGMLSKNFRMPSGLDAIIYLSQSPFSGRGLEGASHTIAVNTLAPIQVAALASESGVRKFIYVSTGTVYGPSFKSLCENSALRRDSWYSLSKVHAEEALALMRGSLDVTVVRPFTIYGPGQQDRLIPKLIDAVRNDKTIIAQPRIDGFDNLRDGGLRLSLCHVDDAADALLHLVARTGPACVNLAASESLSITEIARIIGRQLGKFPEIAHDDNRRREDFVADITLLSQVCPTRFRRFEDGVTSLLA